jgi:23S rRNA (adenine2503-C2)-methyltransferase
MPDPAVSTMDAGPPPDAAPVPGRSLVRKAPRPGALLSDHDAASLAALLERAGGSASAARAVAGKVLRHLFGTPQGQAAAPAWDAPALAALGVGAWAHEALLALDPAPSLQIAEQAPSTDDTVRLVLRARDGELIESVLIPGPARTTLCLSSQVGCARACSFCETGRLGLQRQLSTGEIVDQVRIAREIAAGRGGAPLRNLVFMGMGEPFDNLAEVLRAVRLLTDPRAFRFAPSHVTVSTVGVADKIEAFFREAQAELAVSLNAPDDARRRAIMPVNARFPMAVLKEAISRSLPPGKRVLFEYVLFDAYNDAPEDADLLAAYVAGLRCRVNVIPCNPGPDPALRPPSAERLDAFVARLSGHGVTTLVRRPRGRDVGGACGQLAGMARAGGVPAAQRTLPRPSS